MRYIEPYILKDLERKTVFVGGPRQVGKTTPANMLDRYHYWRLHPCFCSPSIYQKPAPGHCQTAKSVLPGQWDVIGDDGAVFENLVAIHLLKKIFFLRTVTAFVTN